MCLTIDQWTFNKTIQLLGRPALVGIASCLELRLCFLLVLEKYTLQIPQVQDEQCKKVQELGRRRSAAKSVEEGEESR